jgi:thioredoxin 1
MSRILVTLLIISSLMACKKEDVSSDTGVLNTITSLSAYETEIKSGVSLMFFHATWCPKCAAQRPAVEGLTKDSALSKVKIGQVDFEKVQEIVKKYSVLGFPTILIYKDNVLKHEINGQGHSQEKLASLLKALL